MQIGLKNAGGELVHFHQDAAEFGFRIRILAARHGEAVAVGEEFERFIKADAFDLLDKFQNVAADAAAETFEVLMRAMHREGGRFFSVDRAEVHIPRSAAGAFEAHVFANRFDDVHGGLELFDEVHLESLYGYMLRGPVGTRFSFAPPSHAKMTDA